MTRRVFDEEASREIHMDVVQEVDERARLSATLWMEAMHRLKVIDDPLIRRILAVHLECDSGTGTCDGMEAEGVPLYSEAAGDARPQCSSRSTAVSIFPGLGRRLKARPTPHYGAAGGAMGRPGTRP